LDLLWVSNVAGHTSMENRQQQDYIQTMRLLQA